MNLLNNHSSFNKWQVMTGNKINNIPSIEGYIVMNKYTKNLKANLSYTIKELIVKNINSQKNIRLIGIDNIEKMIDTLSVITGAKAKKFDAIRKKDFFLAFRFLHKLTYG